MKSYSTMIMVYVLSVSLWGLIQMAYDKRQAKRGLWRVPEKSLFLTAALGGAMGILMGMKLFRHKTKHKTFTIGVPVLLLLNAIIVGWIAFK